MYLLVSAICAKVVLSAGCWRGAKGWVCKRANGVAWEGMLSVLRALAARFLVCCWWGGMRRRDCAMLFV